MRAVCARGAEEDDGETRERERGRERGERGECGRLGRPERREREREQERAPERAPPRLLRGSLYSLRHLRRRPRPRLVARKRRLLGERDLRVGLDLRGPRQELRRRRGVERIPPPRALSLEEDRRWCHSLFRRPAVDDGGLWLVDDRDGVATHGRCFVKDVHGRHSRRRRGGGGGVVVVAEPLERELELAVVALAAVGGEHQHTAGVIVRRSVSRERKASRHNF